jgi:DNA-directed RNA polymerase specialized sigma24 family protein
MTEQKANLLATDQALVVNAMFRELQPYIKSLAARYAQPLGCEAGDIQNEAWLIINEEIAQVFERANSPAAYLRKILSRSMYTRLRSAKSAERKVSAAQVLKVDSYTVDRQAAIQAAIEHDLTDLEYQVCLSRVNGESYAEFLEANQDVTKHAYYKALESLESKLGV